VRQTLTRERISPATVPYESLRRAGARAMSASMDAPPLPIATPCVKVCYVDGPSGLCLGCFRTLPEIARWGRLTDEERETVMAQLADRRSQVDPAKLG